jgi:hypothetical protein
VPLAQLSAGVFDASDDDEFDLDAERCSAVADGYDVQA